MATNPDPTTPQGVSATPQETSAAAARDTDQFNATRDLADAINKAGGGTAGTVVIKGVVTALEPSGTPTFAATLNGDTVAVSGIRYLDSYTPVVGDVVAILKSDAGAIFCLGQYNNSTGGGSTDNGWVAPTLGSGFTTNSFDPVKYRLVWDNGDAKIQLRGGVSVSGTPTALWTMPSGFRPLFNKPPVLIGRDIAGGSNVAQLAINADGTMVLTGPNTGLWGVSGGTTGRQTNIGGGGATVVETTSNSGSQAQSGTLTSGPTIIVNNGDTAHQHFGNSHNHTVTVNGLDHQHPMSLVTHPTTLSFNGVEYFL